MDKDSVQISVRALMDLLSGNLNIEQFNAAHNWDQVRDGQRSMRNQFARALAQGRLIKSAQVQQEGSKDDDLISFEFGEPDPAISPFLVRS